LAIVGFMTTQRAFNPNYLSNPVFTTIDLTPISSDPDEDWLHPVLEMFRPLVIVEPVKEPRLYLSASTFGEEFDSQFSPEPTSAKDLPDIEILVHNFIHVVVEVWAGRRSASQIQSTCHYSVFAQLQRKSGKFKTVGRVRKIHISQPLDGIIEATVTVRYGERLRVVAIRFEGLDHRWLCTALEII
jgi:hypothetical protein